MPSLRRIFYRSPLHRPALGAHAAYWKARYQLSSPASDDQRPRTFAVGLFRTGTHSLTKMVAPHMKAAHEPHRFLFVQQWRRFSQGDLTPEEWERFLRARDRVLGLSLESSGFLCGEVPRLVRLFSDARFILTIREPVSWARSLLREIVVNRRRLGCHYYEPLFRAWFGSDGFGKGDEDLKRRNLFPFSGMMKYWSSSQQAVIESVPPNQLLVLPTDEVSSRLADIESFIGLPAGSIDPAGSHTHRSNWDWDPLEDVSGTYLNECIAEYASPFLEQFDRFTPGRRKTGFRNRGIAG